MTTWFLLTPAALVACVLAWYHLLPRLANWSLRLRLALAHRRLGRLEAHYRRRLRQLRQRLELKGEECQATADIQHSTMQLVGAYTATATALIYHLAPAPAADAGQEYQAERELMRREQQPRRASSNGTNPASRMGGL